VWAERRVSFTPAGDFRRPDICSQEQEERVSHNMSLYYNKPPVQTLDWSYESQVAVNFSTIRSHSCIIVLKRLIQRGDNVIKSPPQDLMTTESQINCTILCIRVQLSHLSDIKTLKLLKNIYIYCFETGESSTRSRCPPIIRFLPFTEQRAEEHVGWSHTQITPELAPQTLL